MKLIPDETSLVVAGAWNSAIVTPEWIQRFGLKKEPDQASPFQAVIPVGAGMFFEFPRFNFDGMSVMVRPDAMLLTPSDLSEAKMDEIETVAANVVAELKHTPIGGIGHNFGFSDENPDIDFLTAFTDSQAALVGAAPDGWNVSATLLSTTMTFEETQVNIQRVVNGGRLSIKFNFHHTVADGPKALQVLKGEGGYKRVAENFRVARDIIKKMYGDIDEE